MPPEPVRVLEAISICLLLGLALPKRRLPGLRRRLTDLAGGQRRWLYAAPLSWARSAVQRRRLVAEALRVVELGAPLWVVARVLEERSARRRLEARALWMDSGPALLYSCTTGRTSEQELLARLTARELPPPATKATPLMPPRRNALPLDWWGKTHAEVSRNGPDDAAAESDLVVASSDAVDLVVHLPDPDLLSIRTFGRLQLLAGDQDLSEGLLQRPVLAFIWLLLLVRALARPGDRLSRAELAEELTPGLAPERQRKRLRDRLSDMTHGQIPTRLAERIKLHIDDSVTLDLQRALVDFDKLIKVARDCGAKEGLLSSDEAAEALHVLGNTEGEFVPEWDRLEEHVNGSRGASGEIIRGLRQQAEAARVDILAALATNHLARREPDRAIPQLERALERRPDREDLARKLRAAYLETGQMIRAAELQRSQALQP